MNKPFASRRGFQFTLVTLFILTLSVAGTLAGYRIGFRQGYVRGELKRKSEIPFSKVFGVADLVKQNNGDTSAAIPGDYLSLLGIIERTIACDTWMSAGWNGTLVAMPSTQSLVVSQTSDVHEKIENLLTQLRAATALDQQNHANE